MIWCRSKEFGRKNVISLAGEGIMCVSNTWFKREEKRKVTFKWTKMIHKLTLC